MCVLLRCGDQEMWFGDQDMRCDDKAPAPVIGVVIIIGGHKSVKSVKER